VLGAGSLPAGTSTEPAEDARAVSDDVRGLVNSIVADNAQASTIDASTTSAFTVGWHARASLGVSVQVAFATSTGTASTLSNCLAGAQGTSGDRCVIAISVAVGGTAHALVSPGSGVSTNTCAQAGAALAGPSAAIAVATDGNAQALAKRGSDSAGCASTPTPDASSGATGAAIGVSFTTTGSAASSATSGNSGTSKENGASGSGNEADAATGRSGDAIGVAIAKLGAIALVRSGNSGSALATCAGCTLTSLPTGGTAIATSVSGDTGSSYSLAIAGLVATVTAQSGDTGAATSLTGIDSVTAPASGTGVAAIGRSGQTGDVVAVAVSLDSSVSVNTHSGDTGGVVNTALEGDVCASPALDAVITCTADPSATTPVASDVQSSAPGKSIITVGNVHHETLVPALPGTSSVSTPSGTTSSTASSAVAADATLARTLGPTYQPMTDAAHLQRRHVLSAAARQRNEMALLAPMVFGSGLMVLSFVLVAAAVVRRRKARHMRRS
jgi:hypothetical protein